MKELMLRTPGACWRMGGNSQSAQHRKSSADLQLSCQADEHSQLVGGECSPVTPYLHGHHPRGSCPPPEATGDA